MEQRRTVLAVGLTVLCAGAVVAALPAGAAPAGEPASVPAQLPGYSYRTGTLADAPPGRALAVYQQGLGVETMDFPQALAVGADGASARRLPTAMARGAADTQGDAAPMALSPDGSTVAVGDWDAGQPLQAGLEPADLALLDVGTGQVRRVRLPDATAVVPLTWSADGRKLAYLSPIGTGGPFDAGRSGQVFVLDVDRGAATALPAAGDVEAVAFSPDGSELAVQHTGGPLEVLDGRGTVRATLAPPDRFALAGGVAWSPDGTWIAVARGPAPCAPISDAADLARCDAAQAAAPEQVAFLPAPGQPAGASPQPVAGSELLAWASAGEVLVRALEPRAAEGSGDYRVLRADLRTGAAAPFTRIPTGDGGYSVIHLSLAQGVVQEARWTPTVPPADRGRWPLPLRVSGVLGVAGAAALAVRALQRRAGRRVERHADAATRRAARGATAVGA